MALVNYEYSSDSEGDDDVEKLENKTSAKTENGKVELLTNINNVTPDVTDATGVTSTTLFSHLPKTKSVFHNILEDKIEDFIPKSKPIKEKQKVKITIPSLSDFKDEDEAPSEKKFKPSKGSGLISLLPPVRGAVKTSKSFIPNVVANKTKTAADSVSSKKKKNIQPVKVEGKKLLKEKKDVLSDAESDDDVEVPETFDDEIWEKVCGRKKVKTTIQEPEPVPQESIDIAPEPEEPYDGLDNEAFKELVGKTKRPLGNIRLIDINEGEIIPDKDLWMTKSLTDPELAAKPKIENPVDPTRRKKHHITYLAEQAKANEQELQNTWAASKNSRLMSRAKYGF